MALSNHFTPVTLSEAIDRFYTGYDNPQTVLAYRRVLDLFRASFGPRRTLSSITPDDIDAWNQALRTHQPYLSPWTLATRRKRLKVFFNWAVEREYIDRSPARYLKVNQPRIKTDSKAMPGDVLLAMLELARHKGDAFTQARDTAIVALIVTFSARVGDVARLRLSYISPGWVGFVVKGYKENRLPMPPRTWQILEAWLEIRRALNPDPDHDYLFANNRLTPGNRFAPLTVGGITSMIRRLSKEASGHAYGPHSMRHWFGQAQFDAGTPATVIQAIMGHSDVQTTLAHYSNQDYERMRAILEKTELGQLARPAPNDSNIIPFPGSC